MMLIWNSVEVSMSFAMGLPGFRWTEQPFVVTLEHTPELRVCQVSVAEQLFKYTELVLMAI